MNFLKADLDDADEEVERLEERLLEYEAKDGIFLSKEKVMIKIKKMLSQSLHSINITTPSIMDLEKLDLFEVSSSISIKASCEVDFSNIQHQEILEDLENLDNISIRLYSDQDRFCALRDGEELLLASVGDEYDQLLFFRTRDVKQIKMFTTLVMEAWVKGKKINK
ncbi:hypothetical protein NEF87_001350 [Candidatus Lokiarchaeum ossiferum]|uniref:Uncharacterized protein n=1 Tax=Candidatus Lokiarchaeum ossiferum TaxID=2951803 RepID=A0ABY6HNT1_9ARCH|nr:hypothetical protein NEF87_001350 [Candidatus Lokiarchaeum sp. B-35]